MKIAFQPKSIDRLLNYEVLETIGDTILKFLVTLYVLEKYPD